MGSESMLPSFGVPRGAREAAASESEFDGSFYDGLVSPELQRRHRNPQRAHHTPGQAPTPAPATRRHPQASASQQTPTGQDPAHAQRSRSRVQPQSAPNQHIPGDAEAAGRTPAPASGPEAGQQAQASQPGPAAILPDADVRVVDAGNGDGVGMRDADEDPRGEPEGVSFVTSMRYLRPYPRIASAALDRVEAGISLGGGGGMSQHQQNQGISQHHTHPPHHQERQRASLLADESHNTQPGVHPADPPSAQPGTHAGHPFATQPGARQGTAAAQRAQPPAEVVVIDEEGGEGSGDDLMGLEFELDRPPREQQAPVVRAPFRPPRPRPPELAGAPSGPLLAALAVTGAGGNPRWKAGAKVSQQQQQPGVVKVGRKGLVGASLHAGREKAVGSHTQKRLTDFDKFVLGGPRTGRQ